jgi:putative transposase
MDRVELRQKIFDHISVNSRTKGIELDCIGGGYDHVHALISLGADQTIAKIAQLLKGESSHWVNEQQLLRHKFGWQDDYFAASVSESALTDVRRYIENQEEHHRKKTFADEFERFLSTSTLTGFSRIGG